MSQIAAQLVKWLTLPSRRAQVSPHHTPVLCVEIWKYHPNLPFLFHTEQETLLLFYFLFRSIVTDQLSIGIFFFFFPCQTGVISFTLCHSKMKAWLQNQVIPGDQMITCCAVNNITSSLLPRLSCSAEWKRSKAALIQLWFGLPLSLPDALSQISVSMDDRILFNHNIYMDTNTAHCYSKGDIYTQRVLLWIGRHIKLN